MTLGMESPSWSWAQVAHHDPEDRLPITIPGMGCPSWSQARGAHHNPEDMVTITVLRTW